MERPGSDRRGNHIVIKTNGVTTADYTDKKRHFASGYIALQQHTQQTRVEFRKVEIEELDPNTPDPNGATPIDARLRFAL